MERPPDTFRTAARALIISPNREVLLMRIHAPQGGKSFWIAPGGGLDPGEEMESGLRRELREELDLLADSVVPASPKKILTDFLRQGPPAGEPEVEVLVD